MATLSFNAINIKHPPFQSHKPVSLFSSSLLKSIKIPSLSSKPTHTPRKTRPISVSESPVSLPLETEEATEDELLDDPTAELSVTLKDAIESVCDELDVPLPEKIRFFRSQMQTIISKACKELAIKPIASKRCLSLLLWLEDRYETVYMRHPGFQKGAKPLLALDNPFPMNLPDNLYGDRWAFVQLPFSEVKKEVLSLETTFAFGASLDLDLLGIEIDDKALVPGLAVSSSRSQPLAAWMNGLEVCSIEADVARASLILSVGISTRYIYASYKKTPESTNEAEAWEAAKKACGGLHFLAIQDDLDSDDCVGFWLLLDLPPPSV
ncbi:protein TAB2-like [Heracleum sosnowskyi]|uniref:Protein TAB2-like n=1 Tax=Heracleum sosnowskyi TaxID=360622 RepID=A0AAD8JHC5_9APIA|nr:protein TAB2-like [Heracleum sosnowskyi]